MMNRDDLNSKIAQIGAEIASHPMASEAYRASLVIIEECSFGGTTLIEQQLTEHGLPNLDAMAKVREQHALSWCQLLNTRENLAAKQHKLRPGQSTPRHP